MAALDLAQTTQSLDPTADASPVGLVVVDPDGRIDLVNAEVERVFGYDRADLIGRPVEDLLPEQHRERYRRLRTRFMRTPTSRARGSRLEVCGVRKDGASVPIDVSVSRVAQAGHTVLLAAIVDATERRHARQELDDRVAELSQANVELAKFAYIASHDLQEPLRMVSSYLELLRRRYHGKLDAEADEFIGYAIDGAVRMKRLINDILKHAQSTQPPLAIDTVDTQRLVSSVVATLAPRVEETTAKITQTNLPAVRGDFVQLERLFTRLIENALKYRSDKPPEIHVHATRRDGFWRFSVVDNGIGIDPRFKDQVFDMFRRLHTRSQYAGTGIGLAVCKAVVERHGGRIWVEPAPGGGSIFRFTLPDAVTEETAQ